jgi:hypothetical protein
VKTDVSGSDVEHLGQAEATQDERPLPHQPFLDPVVRLPPYFTTGLSRKAMPTMPSRHGWG